MPEHRPRARKNQDRRNAGSSSIFSPATNQGDTHVSSPQTSAKFSLLKIHVNDAKPKNKAPQAPGTFFDIGGRRLHALVTGEERGRRPVVLEAGLTAMSSCWAWVQEELSRATKVLAYDRAGLGWSDPSSNPKDARSIAHDLHALLDAAKFPRPFVFVGHSMGGIFGRAYASLYPHEIAGMGLIDASHPEQIERSPNIKKALRRFFWFLKATPIMASCGVMKVCGDFGMSAQAKGLPDIHSLVAKNFYSSAQHMRATVREAEAWFTSVGQVKTKTLGDVPLVAVTAPEKCMHGWMDLQKELAAISTRGRHVIVPGASHVTILTNRDYAAQVANEVSALLEV
jgi:pimeloyl-ACP methyl ester carboxylesterase